MKDRAERHKACGAGVETPFLRTVFGAPPARTSDESWLPPEPDPERAAMGHGLDAEYEEGAMSAATEWADHYVWCRSYPRCEMPDILDPSQDQLCYEGARLAWKVFQSAPTDDDRRYLMHLGDSAMREHFHAVQRHNEKWFSLAQMEAEVEARTVPTLVPGEYDSDDLDRLVR